jgi:hypothetical protein
LSCHYENQEIDMSEDTQVTDQAPVVTETLDDVISEFNVQPVQPAAQPETVSNEPAQPLGAVDPLDADQFNADRQRVANGQSALTSQLQDVKSQLTELRQERAELQIEADINSAVDTINEGLKLDPMLVRTHLELTAQKKPGFKAIWENRNENPQAYDKALKALSREVGETYGNKQDPDLTANQQAIQRSQQSQSTPSTPSGSGNQMEDNLANAKSKGDFDREWQRMVSG